MPPVHSILQYNRKPSQALAAAEFWTRLLIETRIASEEGHVIGDVLRLRKLQGPGIMIMGIEIEQLQADATAAQRYLDACARWLHRAPFGVERLPVTLVAHAFEKVLVRVAGWRVTAVDVSGQSDVVDFEDVRSAVGALETLTSLNVSGEGHRPRVLLNCALLRDCTSLTELEALNTTGITWDVIPFASLLRLSLRGGLSLGASVVPHMTEFPLTEMCLTDASIESAEHFVELKHLKTLELTCCRKLRAWPAMATLVKLKIVYCSDFDNAAALSACVALRELDLTGCRLNDWEFLRDLTSLVKITLQHTGLSTANVLVNCRELEEVDFCGCRELHNLAALGELAQLRSIQAEWTAVTALPNCSGLRLLRSVNVAWCRNLESLSSLGEACALEALNATGCNVNSLPVCNMLKALRSVEVAQCRHLKDLGQLQNATALERFDASWSGVEKLPSCEKLQHLQEVNVDWCLRLTSLVPLENALALRSLSAVGVAAARSHNWRTLQKLETVNL